MIKMINIGDNLMDRKEDILISKNVKYESVYSRSAIYTSVNV